MKRFEVVEKFVSVNGEGTLAGELSVFIRFKGCNLDCNYCDTKWANREDAKFNNMTSSEILEHIRETGITNVTITGGEPLLIEGMHNLLSILSKENTLNIEVETNGSVDIKDFSKILPRPPRFTLDYKSPSSGMENMMNLDNYRYLKKEDCVKFVVGDLNDLNKAKDIIFKYDLLSKCSVHLSSIFGALSLEEIVGFMKEHRLNRVKLQPQLHKIIWKPDTKGV